ncbi:MAG: hypothetical protein ACLRYY_03780 [Anaerobutyricum soehngenii]
MYYALIDNNIINISKLSRKKAKTNEKDVYQDLQEESRKRCIRHSSKRFAEQARQSVRYLSEEKQDYVNYIYKMLENDGILVASSIDENDQVYLDWKDEKNHVPKVFQTCDQ